ncbi:unnamed protein product [Peniophora sp. CBMAI 1063]|nr:unnamed protein product [Peniophora sp. CBMAI 1063]
MHKTLPKLTRTLPTLALPSLALTMNLRHATLWDDTGTLLIPFPDTAFRIHRPVLLGAAPHLQSRLTPASSGSLPPDSALADLEGQGSEKLDVLDVPENIAATDFAILLDYLSGRTPLTASHLEPLLRISSPETLDIPSVYAKASAHLNEMFPSHLGAIAGANAGVDAHELEPALELAMRYKVDPETKKTLLYRVATSTEFDPTGAHDPSSPSSEHISSDPALLTAHPALSPRTLRITHRTLASLIADFTPTLFTVGAAQHMACTDVIAERWMDDVIGPALADGGVGTPLETLRRIEGVAEGWREHGLCEGCVGWLRGEWEGEREKIWGRLGAWIEEAERAENAADASR